MFKHTQFELKLIFDPGMIMLKDSLDWNMVPS